MIRAWMWFIIDTGWFLLTAGVTVVAAVALVATPVWLGLIHRELVAIREEVRPCECRHRDADGRGPILPRVLPRLRRIGEEAEQASEEPSDPAVRKCSGCGAEWKNLGPGPYEPITECPECPMSMDEFQALQKAARERAAK